LAGLGVLEIKHRSGIYMASVDSKTLASQLSIRLIFNRNSAINLFQVRQVLETAVARWAAEHCDQDGEAKLRKLMKETRECLSNEDISF
jgi:DNA-binding FadR family transcriptional regulator